MKGMENGGGELNIAGVLWGRKHHLAVTVLSPNDVAGPLSPAHLIPLISRVRCRRGRANGKPNKTREGSARTVRFDRTSHDNRHRRSSAQRVARWGLDKNSDNSRQKRKRSHRGKRSVYWERSCGENLVSVVSRNPLRFWLSRRSWMEVIV